ncbi:MAG: aminoglycoside phosphotransferase family protein [Gammaproteobacteria bacterium]
MGIEAATMTSLTCLDLRRTALAEYAARALGLPMAGLTPASGDASFRRYFRVSPASGAGVIAVDAPPEHENLSRFVDVARALEGLGLHVPHVLACDFAQGFALISDLGRETYLMRLQAGDAPAPLYAAAIEALVRLQGWAEPDLPAYDAALLDAEMRLFEDWLLERHLELDLDGRERPLVACVRERLTESALAQPRVAVHRDYHSRNLMVCAPLPGILDFQDAVLGPVTYDLVSLLKDCYVAWPREQVLEWLRTYRTCALAGGLPVGADEKQFLHWFEMMGMQRHLKAAGIFARLWHRDGKPDYLRDIPRTLNYVAEAASALPEFAEFRDFLAARVMPTLEEAAARCAR